MERQIVLNRIKTPDGTILTSFHRHDYKTHLDKNGLEYMVDGGNEYLRRNINEEAPYEELTLYLDDPFEILRENVCRGGRGKDGKQPLTWVPLNKMSDDWVKACIDYNKTLGLDGGSASQLYKKELIYRIENNITISE